MKHYTPIQIRFHDIDQLGHVNNANYLTYFEVARMAYFKTLVKKEIDWESTGLILANTSVNFIVPVIISDTIYAKTKCTRIGTKSFELIYSIVKIKDGIETEVCNGSSVLVCFDYKLKKTIEVPAEWVKLLREYDEVPVS